MIRSLAQKPIYFEQSFERFRTKEFVFVFRKNNLPGLSRSTKFAMSNSVVLLAS